MWEHDEMKINIDKGIKCRFCGDMIKLTEETMTLEEEIKKLEEEIKNERKEGDTMIVRTGKHNKPQSRKIIKRNGELGINLNYEFVSLAQI